MVAFTLSVVVAFVLTGVILGYMKRRPVGTPLTWGEAMFGAMVVFFLLFWIYGVVPHQWLAWADNELNWRADKLFVGPGGVLRAQAQGGSFPFTITYVVITRRDRRADLRHRHRRQRGLLGDVAEARRGQGGQAGRGLHLRTAPGARGDAGCERLRAAAGARGDAGVSGFGRPLVREGTRA